MFNFLPISKIQILKITKNGHADGGLQVLARIEAFDGNWAFCTMESSREKSIVRLPLLGVCSLVPYIVVTLVDAIIADLLVRE